MLSPNPIPESFYRQPTEQVAKKLLGCLLLRQLPEGVVAGIIVETEAYLQDDPASHSYRGRTKRNASMFGPPGRSYVYRIHQSFCVNAVTRRDGVGEAVLIRAVEPVEGIDIMAANRGLSAPRQLTRGPGRLCQAFRITTDHDGVPLYRGDLLICRAGNLSGKVPRERIVRTQRVGVRHDLDEPMRFHFSRNDFVSRFTRPTPKARRDRT